MNYQLFSYYHSLCLHSLEQPLSTRSGGWCAVLLTIDVLNFAWEFFCVILKSRGKRIDVIMYYAILRLKSTDTD